MRNLSGKLRYALTSVVSVVPLAMAQGQTTASVAASPAMPMPASYPHATGIDIWNRRFLVRAGIEGKPDGMVLIATSLGAAGRVVDSVVAMGGSIRVRFDDVGYVRAILPLARVARLSKMRDVERLAIDEMYANDPNANFLGTEPPGIPSSARSTRCDDTVATSKRRVIPAAALTADNQYVPMGDMGVRAFQRAHPTFDGRGVTIGVIESAHIDWLHPWLQKALTRDGRVVPKFAGVVDPFSFQKERRFPESLFADRDRWYGKYSAEMDGSSRVEPTGPVQTNDGTLLLDGTRYKAPHPGRWFAGTYTRVDTEYDPRTVTMQVTARTSFGVLWDSAQTRIWVDTDRDHDFSDETALTDVNVSFSAEWLKQGCRPPYNEWDSRTSFVVAFDTAAGAVRLYEGFSTHTTMVASVAAGHGLGGGASSASAPNARIVAIRNGTGMGHVIEALVYALRDPRIDLISSSTAAGGGLYMALDASGIEVLILQRAMDRYNKAIVQSIGNHGPRTGVTKDRVNAPGVLAVGASISDDSYRAYYGHAPPRGAHVTPFSARGPGRSGTVKPDVLAPYASISAQPCGVAPSPSARRRQAKLVFELPPCMYLSEGTSGAAPHAAGAFAALLSAARQDSGAPRSARHLLASVRAGARFLEGYQAHQQGHGIINLPAAWEHLRRMDAAPPPEIRVEGPVVHALDRYLLTRGRGVGLYERDGWTVGDTGTRQLRLTRLSGKPQPIRYALHWRGNDGTFATADSVALPLNTTVDVAVRVAPRSMGWHSAILEVVDHARGTVVHTILTAIVAAPRLSDRNEFTVTGDTTIPWPDEVPTFVHVPEGTQALVVEMNVLSGTAGVEIDAPNSLRIVAETGPGLNVQQPINLNKGQKGTRVITAPTAGVWEVLLRENVDNVGKLTQHRDTTHDGRNSRISYSFRAIRAESAGIIRRGPSSNVSPSLSDTEFDASFIDRFRTLKAPDAHAAVGVRRTVSGRLAPDTAGPVYTIRVDSGTTSLRVDVTSDQTGAMHLYLFDCTGPKCELWELDHRNERKQHVYVANPKTGTWKVVLDGAGAPREGAHFVYRDIRTGSQYGRATASKPQTNAHYTWTTEVTASRRYKEPSRADAINDALKSEIVVAIDLLDGTNFAEQTARPLARAAKPLVNVPLITIVTPFDRGSVRRNRR